MSIFYTPCQVCGSSVRYGAIPSNLFCYIVCRNCQTAFQHPDFSPSVSYDASYYQPWQVGDHGLELTRKTKRLTFLSWLHELGRFQTPGRILDVGCAMGFFLDVAQESGWEGSGVEISPYAAPIVEKKLGRSFFSGDLMDNPFPSGSFHAVTLLDVLEHLSHPQKAINKAASMLCPGGHMMLNTPDFRSISSVLLGRLWFQRKPEHLFLFSRLSLRLLLEKAGMEIRYLKPAWKWITPEFLESYTRQYFPETVQKLVKGAFRVLPERMRTAPFCIGTGELLAIARKI